MAKILLVDDDPLVRKTLAKAAEARGHAVVAAENGVVALDRVAEHNFDLVITDIIMPDMEGIGLIQALRRKSRNIKIIAISGGGLNGNLDFLKFAGVFGATMIMRKPIGLADFRSALDKCLSENAEE